MGLATTSAKFVVGAAMSLLMSTPSLASDYWLVAMVGEKPNREAYVVELSQTSSLPLDPDLVFATINANSRAKLPPVMITGKMDIVYESVNQPDRVAQIYNIDCVNKRMGTKLSQVLWRHKPREVVANSPMQEPRSFGERQGLTLMCLRGADLNAMSSRKTRQKPRITEDIEAMEKLGFLQLGDQGLSPAGFIWSTFWTDNVRPVMNHNLTEAQRKEQWDELGREIARTGEMINETKASALANIDYAQRRNNRIGAHPKLETWINDSRSNLVSSWGNPSHAYMRGEVQSLVYKNEMTTQSINGFGNVVGTNYYSCNVEFDIQNDKIIDYRSTGNNCHNFLK